MGMFIHWSKSVYSQKKGQDEGGMKHWLCTCLGDLKKTQKYPLLCFFMLMSSSCIEVNMQHSFNGTLVHIPNMWSHVSWGEIKIHRNVPFAQKAYFSQMLHIKFVYIPVTENLLCQKSIHLTCGISRSWLNKQHDYYTGAPCAGDNKNLLKCAVLSQQCHRCVLTAGKFTSAVAR